MTTEERLTSLEAENATLRTENESLRQQVAQLAARVHALENQRATDSHNSSKPPSSDGLARKTKSLRTKSGKKPGGQPGHVGHTLALVETPDQLVVSRPSQCAHCQQSLVGVPAESTERRQVQDLPPLRLVVTEYQAEQVRCPACGAATKAAFPPEVPRAVQYGPHLEALAVYLLYGQLVPYQRTCEVLSDVLGCQLSVGMLADLVQGCAQRLAGAEAQIKAWLHEAAVIGNDETGLYVGGKRQWLHVTCTAKLTHYATHEKRGQVALEAIGILPGYRGTSVHDGFCAYSAYPCRHALCNVHHLRELTFLWEQEHQSWAGALKHLLMEMYHAVETAQALAQPHLARGVRAEFGRRYRDLLAQGRAANPSQVPTGPPRAGRRKQTKAQNLLDRLEAGEAAVFAFVDDFAVPFSNNQAERDIRMVKVQQKISGTFRSDPGAQAFCRIRGYLSTLRKQGHPLLETLHALCAGHTLPALAPT